MVGVTHPRDPRCAAAGCVLGEADPGVSRVTSSFRKNQLPASPSVRAPGADEPEGGPQHPDGLSVFHADVEGKFAATTGRDAKEINHRYPGRLTAV